MPLNNSGDGKYSFATIAGICLPFACAGFLYLPQELQPASWPGGDVRFMLALGAITMYPLATYRLHDGYQVTDGILMGFIATGELIALGMYNHNLSEIITTLGLPAPDTKSAFVRGWWLFVAQALTTTIAFVIYNARESFRLRRVINNSNDEEEEIIHTPAAPSRTPLLTTQRVILLLLLVVAVLGWFNWDKIIPHRSTAPGNKNDGIALQIGNAFENAKANIQGLLSAAPSPTIPAPILAHPQTTVDTAIVTTNTPSAPITLRGPNPEVDIRVSGVVTGTLYIGNKPYPIAGTAARVPKNAVTGWTMIRIKPSQGEEFECQVSSISLDCFRPQ